MKATPRQISVWYRQLARAIAIGDHVAAVLLGIRIRRALG